MVFGVVSMLSPPCRRLQDRDHARKMQVSRSRLYAWGLPGIPPAPLLRTGIPPCSEKDAVVGKKAEPIDLCSSEGGGSGSDSSSVSGVAEEDDPLSSDTDPEAIHHVSPASSPEVISCDSSEDFLDLVQPKLPRALLRNLAPLPTDPSGPTSHTSSHRAGNRVACDRVERLLSLQRAALVSLRKRTTLRCTLGLQYHSSDQ